MSFMSFLVQNYVWIMIVLIVLIVGVIGFLVDSRGKKKKEQANLGDVTANNATTLNNGVVGGVQDVNANLNANTLNNGGMGINSMNPSMNGGITNGVVQPQMPVSPDMSTQGVGGVMPELQTSVVQPGMNVTPGQQVAVPQPVVNAMPEQQVTALRPTACS